MCQGLLFSCWATKGEEHHNPQDDGKKPSPLGIGPGVHLSVAPVEPLHQSDVEYTTAEPAPAV